MCVCVYVCGGRGEYVWMGRQLVSFLKSQVTIRPDRETIADDRSHAGGECASRLPAGK